MTPAVEMANTAAHSWTHAHAGAPKNSASIADSVMTRLGRRGVRPTEWFS